MSVSTRTETQIRADLAIFYNARTVAAQGKSITITTSAGTRVVSAQDLTSLESTIQNLQRELAACLALAAGSTVQGQHNFALANFNNESQR